MNIYVGNLSSSFNESELKKAFTHYGKVSQVNIVIDPDYGNSMGFAFIEMPQEVEAEKAIKALHASVVDGRTLIVNQARPRADYRPCR